MVLPDDKRFMVWDFHPVEGCAFFPGCGGGFSSVGLLLESCRAEVVQSRVHPGPDRVRPKDAASILTAAINVKDQAVEYANADLVCSLALLD